MTGAGLLLRAYLRRDRWMIFWWVLAGVILYWSQAISVAGFYPTQAEFDRAAALMGSNPALIAMTGPARALNTVGGQVAWQSTAFGAILAGLMAMFLVGRHTRAEEESGRDELLRAGAIGRHATTVATLGVLLVSQVLLGALVALSLVAVPLAVADSVALGVGVALCGLVFGGVALVAVQLTASTRTAYAATGALIAASYALRAVGDLGNPVATWVNPIGWYQQMYAFSGLRWWPALPLVAAAVVTVVAAHAVFDRRDYGSGVVPARPGPARAGRFLGTPLGLAWRLQRGAVVGWSIGMLLTGLSYGSIANDAGDLIGDSEAARQMMVAAGGDLVAGFYAMSMTMLALLASGFAVSSALRPRAEELAGHAEALLATARSRTAWLGGHVAVTVLGTLVCLAVGGLGLGVGDALTTGDGGSVWQLTWQTLAWAPAVLVLAALTRLLYGVHARWAPLGWLGLAFAVVVLVLGEVLRFPDRLRQVSPFEHLAAMPVVDFDPVAFTAVLGVAALMALAGWFTFIRRDVG